MVGMRKLRSIGLALCVLAVGMVVANCASTQNNPSAIYKAGVYSATGQGLDGDVKVEVKFSDTAILEVKIVANQETPGLGDEALKTLAEEVVKRQTYEVDVVSGATASSEALLNAVAECVNKATIKK